VTCEPHECWTGCKGDPTYFTVNRGPVSQSTLYSVFVFDIVAVYIFIIVDIVRHCLIFDRCD